MITFEHIALLLKPLTYVEVQIKTKRRPSQSKIRRRNLSKLSILEAIRSGTRYKRNIAKQVNKDESWVHRMINEMARDQWLIIDKVKVGKLIKPECHINENKEHEIEVFKSNLMRVDNK